MPIFSIFRLLPLLIFAFFAFSGSAWGSPAVPPASFVGVCSAIVYDLDSDAILFEQNADERIPPASLTKVMSMFLAMDFIRDGHASRETLVNISKMAANTGGSRMGLRANENVPLGKLLMGMAVSSGNDASFATAEFVGGSAPSFVKMMNIRAEELGMRDSHFENPHGLPAPKQYTTARDMLTLARAYLKAHPHTLTLHNTRTLEHGGYVSWNKNPLLGQYPGADGLKSGWIRASGYNLIFTASRGSKRILAVIMGAPDTYIRGAEACRLLDAGFMVCNNAAVSVAAALDTIPVDLTRINPRKTIQDFRLTRKKAPAATRMAKNKYSRKHPRQAASSMRDYKNRNLTRKPVISTEKARAKRGAHAARRLGGRANRG